MSESKRRDESATIRDHYQPQRSLSLAATRLTAGKFEREAISHADIAHNEGGGGRVCVRAGQHAASAYQLKASFKVGTRTCAGISDARSER